MPLEGLKYLVRSRGRLLGPYTYEQVLEGLGTREFDDIDEVSVPFQRWKAIRDVPDFIIAVEKLRHSRDNVDDDTTTIGSSTMTGSMTDVVQPDYIDASLTEEISIVHQGSQEIVVEDDSPQGELHIEGQNVVKKKAPQVKEFGLASDRRIQKKASQRVRAIWTLLGILAVVGLGSMYYLKNFVKPKQQAALNADLVQEAKAALLIGRYRESMASFKQVYEQDQANNEVFLYLGTLLVQMENQTFLGRQLLERYEPDSEFRSKLREVALGLSYYKEENMERAEEMFQGILARDPKYFPAAFNLGALQLRNGQLDEAIRSLQASVLTGKYEPYVSLVIAKAYIDKWRSTDDSQLLITARSTLEGVVTIGQDYYQEALLFLAYVYILQNEVEKAQALVESILDANPYLTPEHRHNLFLARDVLSWSNLSDYCFQMIQQLGPSAHVKALEGFCQSKMGDGTQAKSTLERAIDQSGQDPLVQSVYAYVLERLGHSSEASVALGLATRNQGNGRFKLPLMLQSRFCQISEDYECLRRSAEQLLRIDASSVTANVQLAIYNNQVQNSEVALRYVERAERLSPHYRPLLEVKEGMGISTSN